jgi:hypothetical protein
MASQLTKQEHLSNYIRSMAQIEACIKPYQEQRRDTKKNYKDNNWLTKEEIKLADKAYSLLKQEIDFDNLATIKTEVFKALGLEENDSEGEDEDD